MPDPSLQASIRQEMQQRRPMEPKRPSGDPLENLEPASDEDEEYVDQVWEHVSRRLYKEGTTEKVAGMIERARPEQKVDAIILASMPFMDTAYEAINQMPMAPPEEAGDQVALQIVDAILEIADESGAQPYSDELAQTALVGVRQKFMDSHPEIFQTGEQQNGNVQPGPSPVGGSGGSRGLRAV